MKVFITGLNGFIARHCAAWLADNGHTVEGTSRSGSGRFRSTAWSLGDPVESYAIAGADVIIHAAHDFLPGAMNTNIEGTLNMERAAAAANVKRQILISSLSAVSGAVSDYGMAKRAQEEHFIRMGHTIVRPGTVIGKGGLFGKIADAVERFPIVPLLDGGKARMAVIGIYDLCRSLNQILRVEEARQYNLYYEEMPSLVFLLRELEKTVRRRTRMLLLPVPSTFVILPLSVLRRLHIRTPIDVENLRGYMAIRAQDFETNLSEVLPQRSSWQFAIEEAWKRSVEKSL